MNTIAFVAERMRVNLLAARAGMLPPVHDFSRDLCRCGAIRVAHVGLADICPSARADSTQSFVEDK